MHQTPVVSPFSQEAYSLTGQPANEVLQSSVISTIVVGHTRCSAEQKGPTDVAKGMQRTLGEECYHLMR